MQNSQCLLHSQLKETLITVAEVTHYSLQAHVPRQAIQRRFRRDERGCVKQNLRKLVRMGLVISHPTNGETTWQLTRLGLELAHALHEIVTKV